MRLLRLTRRVLVYLPRLLAFSFTGISVFYGTHSFPIIAALWLTLVWAKPRDGKERTGIRNRFRPVDAVI